MLKEDKIFPNTDEVREFVMKKLNDKRNLIHTVIVERVSPTNALTTVTFIDSNSHVLLETQGGFCIGYSGEGPCGVYDILLWLGFRPEVAELVFQPNRQKLIVDKDTMDFVAMGL